MNQKYEKIVLIIPPSPWLISDRDIPMLGVLYLSAFLKAENICEVSICDLSSLEEKDWYIPIGDIYGVTGVSPQFLYMKKIITFLKIREPNKPVIVGGVHATVWPEHILDNTQADACVVGPGEFPLKWIMKGELEWKDIPGVKTKEYQTYNGTPNLFPYFPDRDALDYYSYLTPRTFGYMDSSVKREGSIITGRGCPFFCVFCASKTIHRGKVCFSSPSNVVDELVLLQSKYGVEMVNFLDDTFILDRKRVIEICSLMEEKTKGLKWFCLTRADKTDADLLERMKSVGCLSVAIGFESGSNRILNLMNKKITVEQMKESIKKVSSLGMMMNGQLIVGFPSETDEDVELTAKFIKESPEVDTFGLHVFQPFPGTDVWNYPEKYGIEINKNTDFSDYHTIGKHNGVYSKNPVIDARYKYLKDILGNRSREKRIPQ